jgi:hypothetical protein
MADFFKPSLTLADEILERPDAEPANRSPIARTSGTKKLGVGTATASMLVWSFVGGPALSNSCATSEARTQIVVEGDQAGDTTGARLARLARAAQIDLLYEDLAALRNAKDDRGHARSLQSLRALQRAEAAEMIADLEARFGGNRDSDHEFLKSTEALIRKYEDPAVTT